MLIGLLADIHEEVELLQESIRALRDCGVTRFVVLGDIFEMGHRIDVTVAVLSELDSVGVWGNHDFGLCRDVAESIARRYPPRVLEYFAKLQPWVELAGCRFQHIEPFLNPESLEDLWAYGGDGVLDPARSFASCEHRRLFMGHVHRWGVYTSSGAVGWSGNEPIRLEPAQRYLIAIHGVLRGWSAWYDPQDDVVCPL